MCPGSGAPAAGRLFRRPLAGEPPAYQPPSRRRAALLLILALTACRQRMAVQPKYDPLDLDLMIPLIAEVEPITEDTTRLQIQVEAVRAAKKLWS